MRGERKAANEFEQVAILSENMQSISCKFCNYYYGIPSSFMTIKFLINMNTEIVK